MQKSSFPSVCSRLDNIKYEKLFQAPQFMPKFSPCGRIPALVLLNLLTHALEECTHQLVLLWGTGHDQLIGPELAGKDVVFFLPLLQEHTLALLFS